MPSPLSRLRMSSPTCLIHITVFSSVSFRSPPSPPPCFFSSRLFPAMSDNLIFFFFFLNEPPPTEISSFPLHAALPISLRVGSSGEKKRGAPPPAPRPRPQPVNLVSSGPPRRTTRTRRRPPPSWGRSSFGRSATTR